MNSMTIRSLGNGQKVALLINECQRGIVEPALSFIPGLPDEVERRGMIPNIARLLAHFRARQLPVFHLPFVFRPDLADVVVNSMLLALAPKRSEESRVGNEGDRTCRSRWSPSI